MIQGSEVHCLSCGSLTSVDDQFCVHHLLVLKHSCWPRPLLLSLDLLVVPHTKVMMTSSIKKSFSSDFLYLTYPSSEKSCHSNELASQRGWKKGGIGEAKWDGGGESLSKALPVRRGDRSRKRRSPRLAIFKLKGKALWSHLLSLKPLEQLAKGINRLGNSFCLYFLCTQIEPFSQNLLPPFTKSSPIRISM